MQLERFFETLVFDVFFNICSNFSRLLHFELNLFFIASCFSAGFVQVPEGRERPG